MQAFRFFFTGVVLGLCALLSGCFAAHTRPPVPIRKPVYKRVIASDFEGRIIADYVAEGQVVPSEDGYRIWAVQRRVVKPFTLEFHYPLGRPLTVKAPNVTVTPTTKPAWLQRIDRQAMGIEGKSEIEVEPAPAPNDP